VSFKYKDEKYSEDQLRALEMLAYGARFHHDRPEWVWRKHGVKDFWLVGFLPGTEHHYVEKFGRVQNDFSVATLKALEQKHCVDWEPPYPLSKERHKLGKGISAKGRAVLEAWYEKKAKK